MIEKNPIVFISYCQESIEFSDMVLEFSNKLRSEGIDTILDQYVESPKEGWPRWMENSIEASNFVILVCTKEYFNRIMGKTSTGVGKGVKWEGNIIYQHLYNNEALNEKFIPVVFNENDINFIPMPLQGVTHYDVSKPFRYDKLYWRLRGVDIKDKPKLGKLRSLPEKERKSLYVTSPIDVPTWDKATWRGAAFLLDPFWKKIPLFLLPYKNEKYAIKIFKDWIALYGHEDINNEIRVAIVEGEIPGEETGYTIHISANLDRVAKRMDKMGMDFDKSLIMTISRIQRANPTDNFAMFNMFKAQYFKHKEYILMPSIVDEKNGRIKPLFEYGIIKKKLAFRNVKDINENDIDYPAVAKNKPWKKYTGNP